jgi:cytochrome c-type biogenesis protein CcmH
MIWVALICVLALASVGLMFRRPTGAATSPKDHYQLQVKELQEDKARGLLNDDMFAAAKLELDRRLLRTQQGTERSGTSSGDNTRVTFLAIGLVTLIGTFGFYLSTGSPDTPAQPAKRFEIGTQPITEGGPTLIEARKQIEERLVEMPEDIQGWSLLATTTRAMGEYESTIGAYDRLITLDQTNPEWRVKKYEAFVEMTSGQITPAARLALIDLVEAFPDHPAGQFYLGQVYMQNGDTARATATWQALLDRSRDDAPWVPQLRSQLARINNTAPAISSDAIEDIASLSDQEQQAFIESMVTRLEAKLRENPSDLAGWERLANAHIALGSEEDAMRILNEALILVDPADQKKVQALIDKFTRKTNS